ncbi:dentin sialophosphoprotein-like isoform X2 [Daktulosphaira vitifoliae]|uniref:dentin sialophosphoprotein-like isoform X2 n=1 Tax=Daktulosphaira vitifoliae TaxID=58002 RepID=UPI0021AA8BFB|nr:dentin sialophosphoprotein-like isoform X2 [Daktulosphaira vitifoliae]
MPGSSLSLSSSDDSSDESSTSSGSSSSSSCSSCSSSCSSSSSSSDDSSDERSTSSRSYAQNFNLKRKFDEDLDESNKKICCELQYEVDNDWSFENYPWLLDPERELNATKSTHDLTTENGMTTIRGADVGTEMKTRDFYWYPSVENYSCLGKDYFESMFLNSISMIKNPVISPEGYKRPEIIVGNDPDSVKDSGDGTGIENMPKDFVANMGPNVNNSVDDQHKKSNIGEENTSYSEKVDLASMSQNQVFEPEVCNCSKSDIRNNPDILITNDVDGESVLNNDIPIISEHERLDMNVVINNNCSEPTTLNNLKYQNSTDHCGLKCKISTPWGEDCLYTICTDTCTGPQYITLTTPLNEIPVSYAETIKFNDLDNDEQSIMDQSITRRQEMQPMSALTHTHVLGNNRDKTLTFIVDYHEQVGVLTADRNTIVYEWVPEMREIIYNKDSI